MVEEIRDTLDMTNNAKLCSLYFLNVSNGMISETSKYHDILYSGEVKKYKMNNQKVQ